MTRRIGINGWHTMPQHQGQAVRVEYATSEEGTYLVRRRTEPGEAPETEACEISWESGAFEPQNGELPNTEGEWFRCVAIVEDDED